MKIVNHRRRLHTSRTGLSRDVQRDVDAIEDILRIYGYKQWKWEKLMSNLSCNSKPDSHKLQNIIARTAYSSGIQRNFE